MLTAGNAHKTQNIPQYFQRPYRSAIREELAQGINRQSCSNVRDIDGAFSTILLNLSISHGRGGKASRLVVTRQQLTQ